MLDIYYYESFEEFINKHNKRNLYFASKKAPNSYHEVDYSENDFIVFGKETAGLPENFLKNNLDYTIRIPMVADKNARSLNLANSVAIVLYEALRQLNFPGFKKYSEI